MPSIGFHFVDWSDGVTANPRTDSNVTADIAVIANFAADTFTVTYDGNAQSAGNPPVDGAAYLDGAAVTVLDNTGLLVKTGFAFTGWNTAPDGSGTAYAAADTFTIAGADVTLYADWTLITPGSFSFVDQSGLALTTVTTSAPVQVTGLSLATVWTATGGTACVSDGNDCSCDVAGQAASGTVSNNQYLCARHTSAPSYATATDTVVAVGEVSDTFTSTTLAIAVGGSHISGPTGAGDGAADVIGGNTWLFAVAGNGALQSAGFIPLVGHPKSPSVAPPAGTHFAYGLLDFVLAGGEVGSTATVTITYPAAVPPDSKYWKFGPTADDPEAHWYVFPATIVDDTVTLVLTDGDWGDDDLAANGAIVDAGGLSVPLSVVEIPTLSQWGLIVLAALLGLLGAARMRRRSPAPNPID